MASTPDTSRYAYDKIITDITEYVFRYHPQSPKAYLYARTAVLDALGCAIETVTCSAECRSLLGPIIPGTTVPNGFKVPGTNFQVDPVKGAFDLGTMIRYLDHNDALGGAESGHPSDNLGAVLAVSDWLSRASLKSRIRSHGPPLTIHTLLVALIKAYEIQGCFQLRNSFQAVGLDHTILVELASTAVICWLLGLDESQTRAAISQVWMDRSPLRVYRSLPNTIPRKGWAAGDSCSRAVQLALLTKSGQPGAPTVLTTPRWGFYATAWNNKEFDLPKPYGSWVVENIFFKLMPAEGHGISAIEAALEHSCVLQAKGLIPEVDIRSIQIRTTAAAVRIISKTGELRNAADRDHCIQYMVALVLLKGDRPEAQDYNDKSPWATDSRLEALRDRIEVCEDEHLTDNYLNPEKKSAANGVTIELRDGSIMAEIL
ncbi:MAG: hypothetical protein Q9214_007213, partial [Letrouitia sp. 1 TL-2023]